MFLIIFNDPGYITAAPAAFPREYQHARVNSGGDIGDSCHNHFSFTIKVSHHFRRGRHLHISFCVASRAEFGFHAVDQSEDRFDLYTHLSDSLIIL